MTVREVLIRCSIVTSRVNHMTRRPTHDVETKPFQLTEAQRSRADREVHVGGQENKRHSDCDDRRRGRLHQNVAKVLRVVKPRRHRAENEHDRREQDQWRAVEEKKNRAVPHGRAGLLTADALD